MKPTTASRRSLSTLRRRATAIASERAQDWAHKLVWLPAIKESAYFCRAARGAEPAARAVAQRLRCSARSRRQPSRRLLWLHENGRLVRVTQNAVRESASSLRRVPHVRTPKQIVMPRVLAIAQDLLAGVDYRYSDHAFSTYMDSFQTVTGLNMSELALLIPALKLVVLEEFAVRAAKVQADPNVPQHIGDLMGSMRELSEAPWKELLEPLIVFEQVLAADPGRRLCAHGLPEPRALSPHRRRITPSTPTAPSWRLRSTPSNWRSESTRHPAIDARLTWRKSHVGYYLVAEGARQLRARAGVRLPFSESVQDFLRRNPEEFYLGGIEILTLLIVIAIITPVFNGFNTFWGRILGILAAAAPGQPGCSRGDELSHHVAAAAAHSAQARFLRRHSRRQRDHVRGADAAAQREAGAPAGGRFRDSLSRQRQPQSAFRAAHRSARFRPRAPNEEDPLVELCGKLIAELNEKYAGDGMGGFSLFHRHRIYNPREGVWMGWERKRGKLLDFNRLISGEYDSFPVKIGDSSCCPSVRFVLTLDTDTELPRGTAHRLIGAMAHPLNQAIVDPHENIVVAGYGILQPRVGISVQSAAQSRLAEIYSGQTGFDIYTRATSDVYQDLYGEGIFTGKGIYEVETLRASAGAPLPAQRAAQPRPDRRRLRARRTGQRRRGHRRLPVALQRLQPAQASLGARRLADRELALRRSARRSWPSRSQSDFVFVALEDSRQPAPQPG